MINYRKNQPKSIQQRTKSHRDLLSQLQRILFRLYFLEIDSIIPFFQIHNTVIICGLESDLVVRNRYFFNNHVHHQTTCNHARPSYQPTNQHRLPPMLSITTHGGSPCTGFGDSKHQTTVIEASSTIIRPSFYCRGTDDDGFPTSAYGNELLRSFEISIYPVAFISAGALGDTNQECFQYGPKK